MEDVKSTNRSKKITPWIIPILILAAWAVLTSDKAIPPETFPTPYMVFESFIKLLKSGELIGYIFVSTKRALGGLVVGGGIGLILGFINGLSRTAENFLDSAIQMVRTIPYIIVIPFATIWLGIGEDAKLFIIALGVFFPIYLNTFHGVRAIDPEITEMGKAYGLNGFSLFKEVILPGSLPSILVGVKQSLGIMWLILVVVEAASGDSGIGYMALNAIENLLMDIVVLSIIIYALLGKLSDYIVKIFESRLLQWHPNFKK